MARCLVVATLLVIVMVPGQLRAAPLETLLGRPLERDGVHFQVAFGFGGGPSSGGLLHSMELGYNFGRSGLVLAYEHVFVLSDGFARIDAGSDMFGGHMLLFKTPLFYRELSFKLAAGLGESVDLSQGFTPFFGGGWLYGVDFNIPLTHTSGITLGAISFHAVTSDVGHQWAAGSYLAYTWF